MAITTYAELKTAVADFLNRSDLTAAVPTFISLAEADFQRDVRHWRMEKRALATLSAQYSAIPSDWLETVRFYLTTGQTSPLDLITQAELIERKQRDANTSGEPQFYALSAGEFELYPVPDSEYTADLIYYAKIPALSDSNTTNWLLSNAPDVYLYGALKHTAEYLKDDARVPVWTSKYVAAVTQLNAAGQTGKYSGTGMRIKVRSY